MVSAPSLWFSVEPMTPYEHVFATPQFEDDIFPALSAEAELHALDTRNADEFLQLPVTGTLLEELGGAGGTSPIPGIASLAFQGYHFWRHGKNNVVLDEPTTRALLAPDALPIGVWPLDTPAPSGYVRLPANLVWAQTNDATPEPVHGFFYTRTPHPGMGKINLLIALGVRDDRAGVTAIEINVTLPIFPPGHFGDLDARDDGVDFSNVLQGGELRGLFAVTNAGEVLKLVSRVLHHLRVTS